MKGMYARAVSAVRANIARCELACWVIGIALTGLYAVARTDAAISGTRDLARFERTAGFEGKVAFEGAAGEGAAGEGAAGEGAAGTDTALWSASRLALYRSSPPPPPDELVGALVIRGLDLKAPLYVDTSELHLNRGVGLIAKTAVPGEAGNLGIAGHRDGFFRSLKDIRLGETIEVFTRDRAWRYRVFSIEIVDRSDASLLQRSAQPTVTLVTCHPFYFVGHAPRRFVVRGALLSSQPLSRYVSSHGREA